MGEVIRAPWTPVQVAALNAWQQSGRCHPFTCGSEEHMPGSPALVATTDGWVCPQPYGEPCDYRQDWAYSFMAEPQPADELAGRLAGLQRAMAAPLPTPEEVAAGNAADRAQAERLHRLRPGVPLHHVYAVLQAKRSADRIDAAKRPPQDDGDPAPLGWSGQVAANRADGTVEVPVTDTDGNTVGLLRLTPHHADALADMLAETAEHLDATARMTEAQAAEAWLAAQPRRPITGLPLPDPPDRSPAGSAIPHSPGCAHTDSIDGEAR